MEARFRAGGLVEEQNQPPAPLGKLAQKQAATPTRHGGEYRRVAPHLRPARDEQTAALF